MAAALGEKEQKAIAFAKWKAAQGPEYAAKKRDYAAAKRTAMSKEENESMKAAQRAKYASDEAYRAKILAAVAAYRLREAEAIKQRKSREAKMAAERRASDPEYRKKVSDRHAARYASLSPEQKTARAAADRARYAKNPATGRAYSHNRRASKRASPGTHTAADIKALFAAQKGKCPACKVSLRSGYHVDHIVSLARGGANDKANLQLLCPPCNQQKHAKDPIDFMQQRGFLL